MYYLMPFGCIATVSSLSSIVSGRCENLLSRIGPFKKSVTTPLQLIVQEKNALNSVLTPIFLTLSL